MASSTRTVDQFRKYVVANYTRYPVVLVRLANIDEAELAAMLARAHDIQAAKARKR